MIRAVGRARVASPHSSPARAPLLADPSLSAPSVAQSAQVSSGRKSAGMRSCVSKCTGSQAEAITRAAPSPCTSPSALRPSAKVPSTVRAPSPACASLQTSRSGPSSRSQIERKNGYRGRRKYASSTKVLPATMEWAHCTWYSASIVGCVDVGRSARRST